MQSRPLINLDNLKDLKLLFRKLSNIEINDLECENSPIDKQKMEFQKKIGNVLDINNFSDKPCDTK